MNHFWVKKGNLDICLLICWSSQFMVDWLEFAYALFQALLRLNVKCQWAGEVGVLWSRSKLELGMWNKADHAAGCPISPPLNKGRQKGREQYASALKDAHSLFTYFMHIFINFIFSSKVLSRSLIAPTPWEKSHSALTSPELLASFAPALHRCSRTHRLPHQWPFVLFCFHFCCDLWCYLDISGQQVEANECKNFTFWKSSETIALRTEKIKGRHLFSPSLLNLNHFLGKQETL